MAIFRCDRPSTLRAVARRSGSELAADTGLYPQELNDSRHIADLWDGCVAFPTGSRHFVNANLLGNLLLEE
jgi:hypothetical protein